MSRFSALGGVRERVHFGSVIPLNYSVANRMSLVNLSEKIITVQLTNQRGVFLIYVSQSFRAGIYSKVLE